MLKYSKTKRERNYGNAMIRRIDVFNGYELNIELNFNIRQFFEGIAEESEEESLIIQQKTA